jgi:hypothetical protein
VCHEQPEKEVFLPVDVHKNGHVDRQDDPRVTQKRLWTVNKKKVLKIY